MTNCQFAAFVATIGYRMIAERSSNPADYPGRLPQMLKPDPLALRRTRGPVNLRDVSNWRGWQPGLSEIGGYAKRTPKAHRLIAFAEIE